MFYFLLRKCWREFYDVNNRGAVDVYSMLLNTIKRVVHEHEGIQNHKKYDLLILNGETRNNMVDVDAQIHQLEKRAFPFKGHESIVTHIGVIDSVINNEFKKLIDLYVSTIKKHIDTFSHVQKKQFMEQFHKYVQDIDHTT